MCSVIRFIGVSLMKSVHTVQLISCAREYDRTTGTKRIGIPTLYQPRSDLQLLKYTSFSDPLPYLLVSLRSLPKVQCSKNASRYKKQQIKWGM